MKRTLPDHDVDRARRAIVLDELRIQASRQEYITHALDRWDAQIGLAGRAEAVRQHVRQFGAPLCSGASRDVDLFVGRATLAPGGGGNAREHVLAAHGQALRHARAVWKAGPFLAGVVAVLHDDAKFPSSVARMLAPLMVCTYVEWCDRSPIPGSLAQAILDQHDHGDQGIPTDAWEQMVASLGWSPEIRPPCDLCSVCPLHAPEGRRTSDPRRRLPKRRDGHGYLRDRAAWYFEVEIWSRAQARATLARGRPARERDPIITAFIETLRDHARFGSVSAIARRLHPMSAHPHTRFSDTCGCIVAVKYGIAEVKRLLAL